MHNDWTDARKLWRQFVCLHFFLLEVRKRIHKLIAMCQLLDSKRQARSIFEPIHG